MLASKLGKLQQGLEHLQVWKTGLETVTCSKFFVSPLISICQTRRECQRSEEKFKKKDLWKLTPPFFNDFSQWNTSSWHHLSLQSWWEIPSCHVLPPFFFKTAICFDRCTWLISSTQKIKFRPWWGTSTWRRTIVETCGDRVLCLQNTSHDLYMWSRQFLSKTWEKQEMRKVQRLNGYNNCNFRGMSGKNVIWHILLHF